MLPWVTDSQIALSTKIENAIWTSSESEKSIQGSQAFSAETSTSPVAAPTAAAIQTPSAKSVERAAPNAPRSPSVQPKATMELKRTACERPP